MTWKILEPILLLAAAVPTFAIAIVWVVFGYPLGAIAWRLLAGWAYVIGRAVPMIDWNPAGIATGLACVAAVVLALHYFGAWLYREIRLKQEHANWPASWRWKWTLSLTAAVMLMFVAGLTGVGLFRTTTWFLETPTFFDKTRGTPIR
jgi:hypothetical protein